MLLPNTGGYFNRYKPPTQSPPPPSRFSPFGGRIPNRGGATQLPIGPEGAYTAAIDQTGEDYSNIMKRFQDAADKVPGQNAGLASKYEELYNAPDTRYSPYSPSTYKYKRSAELGSALGTLGELSQTGGYSPEDIANLRARGISPIRAVYANAQRNLDRQKSLSGGYSPNYNAAAVKMARELSDQIAGATQNVNAGIAEAVAGGRRAMAPQFASAAGAESETANRYGLAGAEARNRAAETNRELQFRADELNRNRKLSALQGLTGVKNTETGTNLEALRGMLSLYGTTPALASTFGSQAANKAQLEEQAKTRTQQAGIGLVSNYMRNRRPVFG